MAIGTSDGEYYPSSLEGVLASLDLQGKDVREPKNTAMDFFRDQNDEDQFPGKVPLSPVLPGINDRGKNDQDPNAKVRRVEDDSIPENAQPVSFTGPDEEQRASYEKFKADVLDAKEKGDTKLAEYLDTPFGKFMDMLMTGMSAVSGGPLRSAPRSTVTPRSKVDVVVTNKDVSLNPEPRSFNPANDNPSDVYARMKNFAAYMKTKPASGREGAPTIGEILEGLKDADQPQTPYEKAVEAQQADRMIQSLRNAERPDLKLVTENPTQEPQGRPIPGEQVRTQEAQRAANDRNYAMGKGTERVNVGPGKGVLNENKEEVTALIRKGSTPSEIAKKFDITPLAVRNWIKRNGPITKIEDIIKE